MFKIITKRELLLYSAQIQDLRKEILDLKEQLKHERKRAEGAINALLVKKVGLAITPDAGPTMEQQEEVRDRTYNIFAEGEELTEEDALAKLQS